MPRKINRKMNRENPIATRLIQISLKVEDLIYKNRPISPEDARCNLREVTGYKTLCQNDPRSLQVIEKLTRIMEEIIADDAEKSGVADVTHQTIPLIPVSYPIINTQDNTQIPHVTEDANTKEKINNNMDIDVIDLCDGNEKTTNPNKIDLNDFANNDMERAISNLSINDNQESQSILANVSENTDCGTLSAIPIVNTNISKMDKNESATKAMNTDTESKELSTNEKKVVKKRVQKRCFKPPIVTKKLNDTMIKQNKAIRETAIKQTHSVTVNNNTDINSGINQLLSNSLHKPLSKQASKNVKNKSTPHPIQQNKRQIATLNKTTSKIYNSNSTENDLSWVENIRYVREITTDENDPNLSNIGVNFWENLKTPHLFVEQDFVV